METITQPLPIANRDAEPLRQASARGGLWLQRSSTCHEFRHPPNPHCSSCHSPVREGAVADGRGTVYRYVVEHQPLTEVPYAGAVIELTEGPRFVTNVVGVSIEEVEIGLPVRGSFERAIDSISLARFKPTEV